MKNKNIFFVFIIKKKKKLNKKIKNFQISEVMRIF